MNEFFLNANTIPVKPKEHGNWCKTLRYVYCRRFFLEDEAVLPSSCHSVVIQNFYVWWVNNVSLCALFLKLCWFFTFYKKTGRSFNYCESQQFRHWIPRYCDFFPPDLKFCSDSNLSPSSLAWTPLPSANAFSCWLWHWLDKGGQVEKLGCLDTACLVGVVSLLTWLKADCVRKWALVLMYGKSWGWMTV